MEKKLKSKMGTDPPDEKKQPLVARPAGCESKVTDSWRHQSHVV